MLFHRLYAISIDYSGSLFKINTSLWWKSLNSTLEFTFIIIYIYPLKHIRCWWSLQGVTKKWSGEKVCRPVYVIINWASPVGTNSGDLQGAAQGRLHQFRPSLRSSRVEVLTRETPGDLAEGLHWLPEAFSIPELIRRFIMGIWS